MVSFNANAGLFKCIAKSGKVEYQDAPCAKNSGNRQESVKLETTTNSAEVPLDDRKISMEFEEIGLLSALQVIADFSGNQLKVSESVKDKSIQLHYKNIKWREVLNKLSNQNNLSIYVESGFIKVGNK